MKLSINLESVATLREFAEILPFVIERLDTDARNMLCEYYRVAEDVGPHEEEFREIILTLQKAECLAADVILELSYMLNSTADKMEAYCHHGTSYGIMPLENRDISSRYKRAALERLNTSGTSQLARELYDEFSEKINIVNYYCDSVPFYNPLSGTISLNAMADLHNCTGAMSTYFHEVGHMLDDFAGNGHTWLSSDLEFGKNIREDFNVYITRTMIERHCDMMEAYEVISEEISGNWVAGISDIFGSLTGGKCQGDWGHDPSYWQDNPSRVEREAFAHMYEASIGDERKLSEMKRFFPTAYARFEYVIRSR